MKEVQNYQCVCVTNNDPLPLPDLATGFTVGLEELIPIQNLVIEITENPQSIQTSNITAGVRVGRTGFIRGAQSTNVQ